MGFWKKWCWYDRLWKKYGFGHGSEYTHFPLSLNREGQYLRIQYITWSFINSKIRSSLNSQFLHNESPQAPHYKHSLILPPHPPSYSPTFNLLDYVYMSLLIRVYSSIFMLIMYLVFKIWLSFCWMLWWYSSQEIRRLVIFVVHWLFNRSDYGIHFFNLTYIMINGSWYRYHCR